MRKFVLIFVLVLTIVVYAKFAEVATNTIDVVQNSQPLIQNTDLLQGQDGTIVYTEDVAATPMFEDTVEGYKIRYLSDGLEVVGYLFRPKAEGQYPVIIFNRGGNLEHSKIAPNHYYYEMMNYFAAQDYVVIGSQYRGNDGGQGQEEFGGADVNDVLNLIPLIQSLDFVDTNNIFMVGVSRGGMMTYLAIKNNIEINAAAVIGGASNLIITATLRPDMLNKVLYPLIGETPNSNEEAYIERSANYWADQLDVPVLILHGENDGQVNVWEAKILAEKLEEFNKKHKLVTFPQGDHRLTTHRVQRDQEILTWFQTHRKIANQ